MLGPVCTLRARLHASIFHRVSGVASGDRSIHAAARHQVRSPRGPVMLEGMSQPSSIPNAGSPPIVASGALAALRFDNRFVRELPADPVEERRPRQVLRACYSRVAPDPVKAPWLVAHSREVSALLGLASEAHEDAAFAQVFAGNALVAGMQPYATCYGGHQFGNWAGQLGDGRAIGLGEAVHEGQSLELQLKGAGRTPYSRTADGRAVMRSSVREFLCSEAMHHLGVPTTRALCLVGTGERVLRDMFYDGRAAHEPGAVVCRVAPSFLRFGHFEIFAAREDRDTLQRLLDFTIRHHFPELGAPNPDSYVQLVAEVARRTAQMIVHWARVGFVHGVMNTDNMSILGLTIDYGPYGFLEGYDPNWTPNTTDAQGRRYRFGNQPQIAFWNLVRFAEALLPLVEDEKALEEALGHYPRTLEPLYRQMICQKLGLVTADDTDDALIRDLFVELSRVEIDMTLFFRELANLPGHEAAPEALLAAVADAYYRDEDRHGAQTMVQWLARYAQRVNAQPLPAKERQLAMNAVNPRYVFRNYVAQLAIDRAEQGDGSLVQKLLEVLRHPYDAQPEHAEYAQKRPEWARQRAGCSMLSCSS
jgi:uncharacterized protein YdiU (UPF0061 family)